MLCPRSLAATTAKGPRVQSIFVFIERARKSLEDVREAISIMHGKVRPHTSHMDARGVDKKYLTFLGWLI